VCDFLLVRHNYLGPILHRFGYIAGFTVLLTQPLFHPNFGVFSSDQIAHVGVSPSISRKLFDREIIFEEFQPMCMITVPKRYGQTDRQTTSPGSA